MAARCLAGTILMGSLLGSAFAGQPDSSGGAVVKLVRTAKECFSDTIFVTGTFVPKQEAIVTLDEGLRITEVLAAEGDQVKAGQLLARGVRQLLDGAAAGTAARPAAASPVTVKAPAAGLVIQSTARAGAVPSPRGEPLFRIMIDNEIELEVDVPGIHVPKLKSRQTARIKLEDGSEMIGQLRLVPAQIDRITQLGRARLSVAQDPSLRIGMFAEATVDASQSCGVAVPRDAVSLKTEGTSVQLVRDRVVETRQVRLGLSSDSHFEIIEGLEAGDIIVANAGTSLHDGDIVQTNFVDELEN